MRKITLISLIGMWTMSVTASLAQVSTFPQPPPLAPPSEQATHSPSTPAAPGSSTQGAGSNSEGPASPSPSANTPSANSAQAAPVSAATLTSMEALDDKNHLEVGDTISFRVIEDRDDAVTRIVTDTGEVDFPYIGRLKVQGKTCHQVAIELKRLLEVDYYKRATVIVGLDLILGQEKTKHDLAWVIGEVHEEGPQELSKIQPMTVSQVILKAGGFSEYADQRKVRIIHRATLSSTPVANELSDISKAKDGQTIDVKAVFDGRSTIDPVIKPDDYIIVPKRFVNL